MAVFFLPAIEQKSYGYAGGIPLKRALHTATLALWTAGIAPEGGNFLARCVRGSVAMRRSVPLLGMPIKGANPDCDGGAQVPLRACVRVFRGGA